MSIPLIPLPGWTLPAQEAFAKWSPWAAAAYQAGNVGSGLVNIFRGDSPDWAQLQGTNTGRDNWKNASSSTLAEIWRDPQYSSIRGLIQDELQQRNQDAIRQNSNSGNPDSPAWNNATDANGKDLGYKVGRSPWADPSSVYTQTSGPDTSMGLNDTNQGNIDFWNNLDWSNMDFSNPYFSADMPTPPNDPQYAYTGTVTNYKGTGGGDPYKGMTPGQQPKGPSMNFTTSGTDSTQVPYYQNTNLVPYVNPNPVDWSKYNSSTGQFNDSNGGVIDPNSFNWSGAYSDSPMMVPDNSSLAYRPIGESTAQQSQSQGAQTQSLAQTLSSSASPMSFMSATPQGQSTQGYEPLGFNAQPFHTSSVGLPSTFDSSPTLSNSITKQIIGNRQQAFSQPTASIV